MIQRADAGVTEIVTSKPNATDTAFQRLFKRIPSCLIFLFNLLFMLIFYALYWYSSSRCLLMSSITAFTFP